MKARLSLPSAAVKSITSVNCRQKCTAVHCKVSRTEIEKSIIRQPPIGEKDDYVKTPGSPAAAEEGGEEVGGERWESGERSEVQARSTLTSTAPKARSRSGEVATLDEVPRISLRVSRRMWFLRFYYAKVN